ncbi:hypothetical protein BKA70DRAFT_1316603 [Coprinopsis sp. MPI-PUGE-AT-0042]|nr:hypothetical protein BKA70DRAFT_1316603 [Coprinopsis sp. MPI-PUGE-AT-0042]
MPGSSKAAPTPAPVAPPSHSLPKRPAEDPRDVEEFGAIVNTRPTKSAKTKPSQTAGSPPPSSSSGGLVLPGSSSSLSALAPEFGLPSSNSIPRYGAPKAKVAAAPPPPPPPPPEIQEPEDSDDEADWDEVTVPTNAQGVSTPAAASTPADIESLEDEIFGDLLEEVDGNAPEPAAAEGDIEDLEDELAREFEEAGLGAEISEDSDEEMEPVTPGVPPVDQGGPILSLNQMYGGAAMAEDSDFSSSSDDDSDY